MYAIQHKVKVSCNVKLIFQNPLCDPWILPVIQGYIQIEDCRVEVFPDVPGMENNFEVFKLCILSRRSRFRAGTRQGY